MKVAVDGFHNKEKDPHYRWEGTYPGGYSEFGKLLRGLGHETATIEQPLGRDSLAGVDMLIIVDPDIPSEAETPNYISPAEAAEVERWVNRGGILLLFGNDPGNAEFEHFNGLARRFGIEFLERVHKDAQGAVKLRLRAAPNHPVFPGGLTFYAVQVAPLAISAKTSRLLLEDNGDAILALVEHGKGRVVALGDPWLYNEYIRSQDNYRIAEGLIRFLGGPRLAAGAGTHPLAPRLTAFLERQQAARGFEPTGLQRGDYLRVIEGQVQAMRQYQNAEGRIVDPVQGAEFAFATPCYAHAVAALAAGGRLLDASMLESGMRAMDAATADMASGKAPDGHGDFFTYPAVLSLRLYETVAPPARLAVWRKNIAALDRAKLYRSNKPGGNNWNIVNSAGEFLRSLEGMTGPEYTDECLQAHLKDFSPLGMFNETGNPLAYDHFSRYFLGGMLHLGYRGARFEDYRGLIWKGAWTSLFTQSPAGELPAGYRSAHHIWNEAQAAGIYEVYARDYALAGKMAEAGAFRRAAMLSLRSILRWIRPDGSGFIVKNRFPPEARHGYESYSRHTTYNLLACSMLAAAWQIALDDIAERPAPADLGGYVLPVLEPFHKVFASAAGSYVEYDTRGDHVYNPTGLIRVHLRGVNPQLGPSDGCASKFSGEGMDLAVGPAWRDAKGEWQSLAAMSPGPPRVEVLAESPDRAAFRVDFASMKTRQGQDLPVRVRETITAKPGYVLLETNVEGKDVRQLRITYPMLVFDGLERTAVELQGSAAVLKAREGGVRFEILEPRGVRLSRTGKELGHRNGIAEALTADVNDSRAVCRISAVR